MVRVKRKRAGEDVVSVEEPISKACLFRISSSLSLTKSLQRKVQRNGHKPTSTLREAQIDSGNTEHNSSSDAESSGAVFISRLWRSFFKLIYARQNTIQTMKKRAKVHSHSMKDKKPRFIRPESSLQLRNWRPFSKRVNYSRGMLLNYRYTLVRTSIRNLMPIFCSSDWESIAIRIS